MIIGRKIVTVHDIIERLLPNGSVDANNEWNECPDWPPDLFAVIATLADLTGFYAQPRFTASCLRDYWFRGKYVQKVKQLGRQWARKAEVPNPVKVLWQQLLVNGNCSIVSSEPEDWQCIAMELLSIADEAAKGLGFAPFIFTANTNTNQKVTPFFELAVLHQYQSSLGKNKVVDFEKLEVWNLPYFPHSLCIMVPEDVACVQPKTNTPTAGCTLRSLSHHLALLPPVGTVKTNWLLARLEEGSGSPRVIITR